jgi:hypothetical protein
MMNTASLTDSAGLGGYEASFAVQLLVCKLHVLKQKQKSYINAMTWKQELNLITFYGIQWKGFKRKLRVNSSQTS